MCDCNKVEVLASYTVRLRWGHVNEVDKQQIDMRQVARCMVLDYLSYLAASPAYEGRWPTTEGATVEIDEVNCLCDNDDCACKPYPIAQTEFHFTADELKLKEDGGDENA